MKFVQHMANCSYVKMKHALLLLLPIYSHEQRGTYWLRPSADGIFYDTQNLQEGNILTNKKV
jgi:hypothetical protein